MMEDTSTSGRRFGEVLAVHQRRRNGWK